MTYNIRLLLEYDGTNYHGWQRQAALQTIQGTIEDVLTQITKKPAKVSGAGRTDAGVHAIGQAANFKTTLKLKETSWVKAINSLLPDDILVKSAEYAAEEFHARHSAKSKIYQYIILNHDQISPFIRNYVYQVKQHLDITLMKKGAEYMTGTHDFSSFRASECSARSPVRTLNRLEITSISYKKGISPLFLLSSVNPSLCHAELVSESIIPCGSTLVIFTFEARSYLQHMVRNIVGTLIDVGRGKIKPSDIKTLIEKKDRRCAGQIAPSHGLYLIEVRY